MIDTMDSTILMISQQDTINTMEGTILMIS